MMQAIRWRRPAASARITLDEYRRRAALGEFSGSKSAELLEGVIVPKARQSLRARGGARKDSGSAGKVVAQRVAFADSAAAGHGAE